MRLILYFIIFSIVSFTSIADNIATIKISYIINNSNEFKIFLKDLDSIKSKFQSELELIESDLSNKKNNIEETKGILSDSEYDKLVFEFNNDAEKFDEKINNYEKIINLNIEKNKELILIAISDIVKEMSHHNDLDLIINEDQYFISSNQIDISKEVLDILNNKEINLKIINNID